MQNIPKKSTSSSGTIAAPIVSPSSSTPITDGKALLSLPTSSEDEIPLAQRTPFRKKKIVKQKSRIVTLPLNINIYLYFQPNRAFLLSSLIIFILLFFFYSLNPQIFYLFIFYLSLNSTFIIQWNLNGIFNNLEELKIIN